MKWRILKWLKLLSHWRRLQEWSVIFGLKKRKGNIASENRATNSLEVRRQEASSRHGEMNVQWNGVVCIQRWRDMNTWAKQEPLFVCKWVRCDENCDLGKINPVAQHKLVWVIKKLVAKKANKETVEIFEMWMLKNFTCDGSERNRQIWEKWKKGSRKQWPTRKGSRCERNLKWERVHGFHCGF